MDTVDVRDLSEEEVSLVAAFVEFLRQRKRRQEQEAGEKRQETRVLESAFAVWPLGVQGTLAREDLYDYL